MSEETTTIETPAAEAPVTETPVEAVEAAPEDILGTPAPEDAPVVEEAPAVPEAYDLTPPEGWEGLDPALLETAAPVFKELGLSNEAANKLMPLAGAVYSKATADVEGAMTAAAAAQKADWARASKADPAFSDWAGTVELSAKGLDAMGFAEGHPFRVLLNETGLGNHPDMVRVFRQLGELSSEGTFVAGGAAAEKIDPLKRLYPNG